MKFYETIFIARQDMSPAQVEALTEKFVNVVTENGGTVGKTEYCGLRPLAYLIKKNRKGHYVLMNVTADAKALAEMERVMYISEDVLRYLSVKVEAHETGPSALLKANRYSREEADHHRPAEGRIAETAEEEPAEENTTTKQEEKPDVR